MGAGATELCYLAHVLCCARPSAIPCFELSNDSRTLSEIDSVQQPDFYNSREKTDFNATRATCEIGRSVASGDGRAYWTRGVPTPPAQYSNKLTSA
jgi:hypothetical protein